MAENPGTMQGDFPTRPNTILGRWLMVPAPGRCRPSPVSLGIRIGIEMALATKQTWPAAALSHEQRVGSELRQPEISLVGAVLRFTDI